MKNIKKWILKFVRDWSIKREAVLIDIANKRNIYEKCTFYVTFF
jgi:hypothetical protein